MPLWPPASRRTADDRLTTRRPDREPRRRRPRDAAPPREPSPRQPRQSSRPIRRPSVGSAAANGCVRPPRATRCPSRTTPSCLRCRRWSLAPARSRKSGQPASLRAFCLRRRSPLPRARFVAQRPGHPRKCRAERSSGPIRHAELPSTALRRRRKRSRSPSELPKVTQILPYIDYEPDPKIAKDNPCENQCPTPDGKPCKTRDGRILDCPKEIAFPRAPCSRGPTLPACSPGRPPTSATTRSTSRTRSSSGTDMRGPSSFSRSSPSVRMTVQAAGLAVPDGDRPCCSNVYPLGYYRPGECSPKLIYQIPLNLEAALVEAGAITGVYFLFPHSAWAYAHARRPETGCALPPVVQDSPAAHNGTVSANAPRIHTQGPRSGDGPTCDHRARREPAMRTPTSLNRRWPKALSSRSSASCARPRRPDSPSRSSPTAAGCSSSS